MERKMLILLLDYTIRNALKLYLKTIHWRIGLQILYDLPGTVI